MENLSCRICHAEYLGEYFLIKEMMQGLEESFRYFQCTSCGCLQIVSPPTNFEKYYGDFYYSFQDNFSKNLVKKWAFTLRAKYELLGRSIIGGWIASKYPNSALRSLKKIGLSPESNILDIGCGSGSLIYSLKELGFVNVQGLDPYITESITYSNGVSVIKDKLRVDIFEKKWDLIMLHHVLEHIWEQEDIISTIKESLAPNGTILIRIPTTSSYAWDYYKEHWFQIDAPRHFFIHSIDSFEILLEKYNLKIAKYQSDSDEKQFWISEQYKNFIPLNSKLSYHKNPSKSIFSKIDILRFKELSNDLNQENRGDQCIFIINHK